MAARDCTSASFGDVLRWLLLVSLAATQPLASAFAGPGSPPARSTAATAWIVTSTADTSDGTCDADCTLREAILAANAGDSIGFSTLFDTPQTIRLGAALPDVNVDLTIDGPGAQRLTVRRETGGDYTILLINAGVVHISGVTIANGYSDYGGGINNFGSLTLSGVVLSGNHANFTGGGLQNAGPLAVSGSAFVGNSAANGGALFNFSVPEYQGVAVLENTTIAANSATEQGPAVYTITYATAPPSSVTLTNCTVAGNSGGVDALIAANGGDGAAVALRNTILANNATPSIALSGVGASVVDYGHNLASDSGGGLLVDPSDLLDTDPQLSTLANHGGPTPTFLPALGSAAIDAGGATGAPASDQRGVTRAQGTGVDVGAVELRPRVVTSAADPGDGTCDSSCTLRDAVIAANSDAVVDDVFFDSLFDAPQVINLGAALPQIASDLTLNGPGARLLTLRRDTGGNYTVLDVGTGFVYLGGLTVANGFADFAGGINNSGYLTIDRAVVSGNHANVNGGGIHSDGALTILDSTISGNTAGWAAGVFVYANGIAPSMAVVTNSTISDNAAANFPGGVEAVNFGGNAPYVRLENCTVAGNTASSQAGLVASDQGGSARIELRNTVVVNGDATPTISTLGASAQVVSLGNNLSSDAGGGVLGAAGDLTGIDPRLMKLADYGGPTPTRYPKPGSPLIDAGADAGAPAGDQRGVARPIGAHVDIGAVEADGAVIFADGFDAP